MKISCASSRCRKLKFNQGLWPREPGLCKAPSPRAVRHEKERGLCKTPSSCVVRLEKEPGLCKAPSSRVQSGRFGRFSRPRPWKSLSIRVDCFYLALNMIFSSPDPETGRLWFHVSSIPMIIQRQNHHLEAKTKTTEPPPSPKI